MIFVNVLLAGTLLYATLAIVTNTYVRFQFRIQSALPARTAKVSKVIVGFPAKRLKFALSAPPCSVIERCHSPLASTRWTSSAGTFLTIRYPSTHTLAGLSCTSIYFVFRDVTTGFDCLRVYKGCTRGFRRAFLNTLLKQVETELNDNFCAADIRESTQQLCERA